MHRAAEALLDRTHDAPAPERGRPPADLARGRLLPAPPELEDDDRDPRTRLVAQLAADRLRELRDDGVTLAYIARMYAVGTDSMERLYSELLPSRPR